MPHKRAKSSIRAVERKQKGSDLAPSGGSGSEASVSKRASWVLGAEKVRREWNEKKKRQRDGEDVDGGEPVSTKANKRRKKAAAGASEKLPHKILAGESLGHFNKRIEAEFRPTVRAAVKSSTLNIRPKKPPIADTASTSNPAIRSASGKPGKVSAESAAPVSAPQQQKARNTKTEFDTLPRMTRLNDVALAPPTLTRATKKAPVAGVGAGSAGLSMATRAALEEERERVIKRYREMKEMRREETAAAAPARTKKKRTDIETA